MHNFLHIIPYANNGGTEKDCYYIINEDKDNMHEVWVLGGPGPMSLEWEHAGAKVEHLNILRYSLLRFGLAVRRKLTERKFDGIFYWSTIRLPLVRYAANTQRCKMAVHIGNPVPKSLPTLLKNKLLHGLFPSSKKTRLFSCSEYVKTSVSQDSYLNKFEKCVSLNPVKIPGKNSHVAGILDKNSAISLGMVARLDPIKDHVTVIKGFSKLREKFPKATLHLIGDGVLLKALQKNVTDLMIDDCVVFHGNRNDVYEQLQTWDIFVYATTPQEGLGNAVSEALANGLPCVLSDLPMLREITGDSDCALFFKPGDANDLTVKIEQLIQDRDLRQKFSDRGYERARAALSSERYLKERTEFLIS